MACAVPAYIFTFGVFLAIYQGLHAVVVETVRLDQIHDVELVDLVFARVGYSEVEPLAQLLRRPMVKLQIEVVLPLAHLGRSVQVPTLEPRLEDQRRVGIVL